MANRVTVHIVSRLLPIAIVAVSLACIEPFVPAPSAYSRVLVVDGSITDEKGPYTIKLSRTVPLDKREPLPETGAEVSVSSAEVDSYLFDEVSPGVYQSDADSFKGMAGDSYTLQIVTSDGKRYLSNPVVLKKSPPIDSVYFEPSGRYENITGDTLAGVAILLDTHDSSNATRYYRWEWKETWEIRVPYPNTYDWVPEPEPPGTKNGTVVQNDKQVGVCFDSAFSTKTLIYDTDQLSQDRVSKFELNFVDTRDFKLRSLYNVRVKQYAIDENEYRYWTAIEKTSESTGTLFDPLPYEIRGNVYNPDDLDETVLGYFSATGVTEKELFIDRRQLQQLYYPDSPCEQELVKVELRFVFDHIQAGYVIAFLDTYGSIYVYMAPTDCCDCTQHGTLEKPNFWPS